MDGIPRISDFDLFPLITSAMNFIRVATPYILTLIVCPVAILRRFIKYI
jgi:hypothetical protein